MFTIVFPAIIDIPELRALVAWLPLAKGIPVREYPLFCTRFFFIASGAAHAGIEPVLLYGLQQRNGLQFIPAGMRPCLLYHSTGVNTLLHQPDNKLYAIIIYKLIPELYGLIEVVTGINMYQSKRQLCRKECFL